ncbi:hypothetical protein EPO34_03715 [Patescibacteria group bacterium]|nr:MAG: hypothetical protein EPO34_03715 [Patescibacteria group bacterium]
MADRESFSYAPSTEEPTKNELPKEAAVIPAVEEVTKAGAVPEISPEVIRKEAAELVREKAKGEEKPALPPRPERTMEDDELEELGKVMHDAIMGKHRETASVEAGNPKLPGEARMAMTLAVRDMAKELMSKLDQKDQRRLELAQALVKNAEEMASLGTVIWFDKGAKVPADLDAKVEEIRARFAAEEQAKEQAIEAERATPEYQARLASQQREMDEIVSELQKKGKQSLSEKKLLKHLGRPSEAEGIAKGILEQKPAGPTEALMDELESRPAATPLAEVGPEDKTFVPEKPFFGESTKISTLPTETVDEQQARIRADVEAQDVNRVFGAVQGERSMDAGKVPRGVEMMTRAMDAMEGKENEPEEDEEKPQTKAA